MLRSFRRGSASSAPEIHQDDDERLRELGYKPVLRRSWRKYAAGAGGLQNRMLLGDLALEHLCQLVHP
jgi:hypothetical protein